MSDEQFVIWLRGFCDAIRTTPSVDQWERVKEKLSSVQEQTYPVRMPVFPIPIQQPYIATSQSGGV